MTWTYGNDPGTSTASERRDAVRLYIGDTDTSDQQLTDEEIAFLLTLTDNGTVAAAIKACRILQAKYARDADKKIGKLSVSAGQRAKAYADLAATLEDAIASSDIEFFAGGISVSDSETQADNSDNIAHAFEVGMDDWGNNDPIDYEAD